MSETVGDFIVKRMVDWGVQRIYGYPGDGINGLMAALRKAKDLPRFIQVRHEEMAAFMACAHAKFTGEIGVCLGTSGPGAIHLLNGLYDAKMDHQPVVAIVGQSATTVLGSAFQQEVDLHNLFKDVAGEFVTIVSHAAAARHAIDRAFRIAKDQRTVTCVILPKDIQEESAIPNPPQTHDSVHSGVGYWEPRVIPKEGDLRKAAEILNAGEKVAMLVGAGALGATDEVLEVGQLLGAGIAKSWLGKAAVPDDVPFCTGHIGLLGTKATWDMIQACDTLFVVGCSFPYGEFYPKEGQCKGVQIDIDGRMLSLRYPMDIALKGDARETLIALRALLKRKENRSWQKKVIENTASWWKIVEAQAMESANPLNPQRVFWELSSRLPDNCILSADSGTAANWYARDIKTRRGMMASGSGNLASMGPAVPYAVAAKFCFPERVAIALTGDGAMQMNGLNACITVGKYWKEWSDPRWIALVLNNRDLNMVTWEQRIMTGDIKFEASQDLPDFPYAHFAEECGLRGIHVDHPDAVGDAWDEALHSDRPVIIEAITDPDVPPLPPHITLKQAKNFAATVLKGDPNTAGIMKQAVKGLMDGLLPHGD
ncbi:MAG TPA: thiamine pyrophosphate-requiring protein [Tepidisphaeraceae bacterium]|jgi:pyruvate dehydrogenase (quinone)|nr:thiamine pyrophosphate-requiring protein [Tepidisphaeraceae bacterium]